MTLLVQQFVGKKQLSAGINNGGKKNSTGHIFISHMKHFLFYSYHQLGKFSCLAINFFFDLL